MKLWEYFSWQTLVMTMSFVVMLSSVAVNILEKRDRRVVTGPQFECPQTLPSWDWNINQLEASTQVT